MPYLLPGAPRLLLIPHASLQCSLSGFRSWRQKRWVSERHRNLSPQEIREAWGADCFVPVPRELVEPCGFCHQDLELLTRTGLPVAPRSALTFELRFESVQQQIDPLGLKFLRATAFERPTTWPRTGDTFQDSWIRLDRCVVIGRVKREIEPGKPGQLSKYLCVDPDLRKVCWVSTTPMHRQVHVDLLNSNLHAFLSSMLAYKRFRAHWPALDEFLLTGGADSDERGYHVFARSVHAEFIESLRSADPNAFPYFWEALAWNEAILIELEWQARLTGAR